MWLSQLRAEEIFYRSGKKIKGNRRDAMNSNRLFFQRKNPNYTYRLCINWMTGRDYWVMYIEVFEKYADGTQNLHHRRRVPPRFVRLLRRKYPGNRIQFRSIYLVFALLQTQSREAIIEDAIQLFRTHFPNTTLEDLGYLSNGVSTERRFLLR